MYFKKKITMVMIHIANVIEIDIIITDYWDNLLF